MPLPEGTVLTVEFTLDGQSYIALNGGPTLEFTEAVSFQIICADQDEVDHYWDGLIADGGRESQCGWLKDRFGLSWQVVPRRLVELMSDPDAAAAQRFCEIALAGIACQARMFGPSSLERARQAPGPKQGDRFTPPVAVVRTPAGGSPRE